MTPIFCRNLAAGLLMAGVLSACSPSPYVLQDRVYGNGRPPVVATPPPPARPPAKPTRETPPATASTKVVTQDKRPTVTTPPPTRETPDIIDAPDVETEVLDASPAKTYKSSPAVQALVRQADAAMAKNDFDMAASTIERALRIESDNPELWLKLGTINARQGKHEQAASMASKAKFYQEQLN
ncbi:MAG: hypothetical protein R3E93_09595 [Thiothrix sp.]